MKVVGFGLLLGLAVLAVIASSCGKNEDDGFVPYNGRGYLYCYGYEDDSYETNVWMNNHVVKTYHVDEKVHINFVNNTDDYPYYELSTDRIEKMLSDGYYIEEAGYDKTGNGWAKYLADFRRFVKSSLSKYRYVAQIDDYQFLFFNRTSDINY
jgi:hypothetical protein